MAKQKKKVEILGKEEKVTQPKTVTNEPKNAPTPAEQVKEITKPLGDTSEVVEKGTVPIPPVKEKVDAPAKNEPIQEADPNELAFGHMDDTRSMKFKIDPDNVKAPSYSTDDFRDFFYKFEKEKVSRPNVLFINSESLEKLGYRDVATDLGLHIKEGTGYKKTELVLAVDL